LLRRKISDLWVLLTGSPIYFPLEHRIFHSICLIALAALAYNVPFNYFIGLHIVALMSFITLVIFTYLYYASRVKHYVKSSIIICGIVGHILFFINYFCNAGIKGPTDLLFSLAALFMLSVAPKKQYRFWLPVNIAAVLGLHAIEYYYPQYISYGYTERLSHFTDISSAYLVVVTMIYFAINYTRSNYELEKHSAEQKAIAIQTKNQRIQLQNIELEKLNTEKNKLMSIIAHDLRSPLSNIQNYLELMADYDLETDERKIIERDLLKITQSTAAMLSKLLTWSKAQLDGVAVKLDHFKVHEILRNTLEMEKAIAAKKEIVLSYKIDQLIQVVADTDMLQLVIRNLINNAIKFTPIGGTIHIDAKELDGECQITVSDTGTGMTFEQQQTLFSLNARSTFGTQNEKGVGLGLLLCKEFTELQNGRIWLESEPGEGTAFHVSLPLWA
jgi:two-component system sensor histidine kinase/response regulator